MLFIRSRLNSPHIPPLSSPWSDKPRSLGGLFWQEPAPAQSRLSWHSWRWRGNLWINEFHKTLKIIIYETCRNVKKHAKPHRKPKQEVTTVGCMDDKKQGYEKEHHSLLTRSEINWTEDKTMQNTQSFLLSPSHWYGCRSDVCCTHHLVWCRRTLRLFWTKYPPAKEMDIWQRICAI